MTSEWNTIDGKCISKANEAIFENGQFQVDLGQLRRGLYVLKIKDENGIHSFKLSGDF